MTKRIQSGKVLGDKAFKIASNPKYDGYQKGLCSIAFKFIDKKSIGSGIKAVWNQQLSNELHKPIIRNVKKRNIYSSFKDNIWADKQLLRKHKKWIRYFLCFIDIFSKYG